MISQSSCSPITLHIIGHYALTYRDNKILINNHR